MNPYVQPNEYTNDREEGGLCDLCGLPPKSHSATPPDHTALRIAIAEKMGWTQVSQRREMTWKGLVLDVYGTRQTGPMESVVEATPDYTGSADEALLLVEHMRKEGYPHFFAETLSEGGYWAAFSDHETPELFSADAPTFPLAVSLAFSKANNLEP